MTAALLLLRVEAPHFVAGAEWERREDGWRCVRAAPILRWMVGKPAPEVAAYLTRKGWSYSWLALLLLLGCTDPCTPQDSGIVEHPDGSVTSSQRVCG